MPVFLANLSNKNQLLDRSCQDCARATMLIISSVCISFERARVPISGVCGRPLLRLEAGSHSLAAIRFYDRLGFRYCDAFAPYAAMPPAATITSVFMEKAIG